jgi:hypothetical protein
MRTQVDTATLQMALVSFQSQLAEINEKVREIQRILGPGPGKASRLSAAAREKAAAQRKRRAAFHKDAGATKAASPTKRILSPKVKAKAASA